LQPVSIRGTGFPNEILFMASFGKPVPSDLFSDEKVNVSSTKSTNPGKGSTKAGKLMRRRKAK